MTPLNVVTDVVRRFGLTSLYPALRACEVLSGNNSPIDVAVLGQFKSGKSSLLNAVLGEAVFPVGALPVTSVITRAAAGPERVVIVTHHDGSKETVQPSRLAEFVSESGNPNNRHQVAVVDVLTPAMNDWPGVRLVDTPGLGSVFAHNTQTTRAWMSNAAVALVTVSAERPLSDEDRRLIAKAREIAPRVVVLLTKVDLLPVAVSRAFMTNWDLLWWLLPMGFVGGLFRRHILGRVSLEVEKNLFRLAGDWAGAVDSAVMNLRKQAIAWVDAELATLHRLLGQRPGEAAAFREAIARLGEARRCDNRESQSA